ncbi:hypothetical protein EOL96_04115 [Candidatus Saccharibacteria bacterium]|nr:hypothetical protein [Candidatus Saccharibacteria bacterium]
MTELPPTNEYPYDFADQQNELSDDSSEGGEDVEDQPEEELTLAELAEQVREAAIDRGLPTEVIQAALEDLRKTHGSPETTAAEDRASRIMSGFEDINARLSAMEKDLGEIGAGLELVGEALKEFFDKLIALIKQVELYMNKIANSTDELEKRRLAKELQDVINRFEGSNTHAAELDARTSKAAA